MPTGLEVIGLDRGLGERDPEESVSLCERYGRLQDPLRADAAIRTPDILRARASRITTKALLASQRLAIAYSTLLSLCTTADDPDKIFQPNAAASAAVRWRPCSGLSLLTELLGGAVAGRRP